MSAMTSGQAARAVADAMAVLATLTEQVEAEAMRLGGEFARVTKERDDALAAVAAVTKERDDARAALPSASDVR